MRLKGPIAAVIVGLFLDVSSVAAATPGPASVQELIDGVQRTYGGATSIRADFVQVSGNASMGTQVRQSGRLELERPRKMRVDMGSPVTQTLVSDGKTLWAYSVKDKQVYETPEMGGGGGMGILLEDLSRLGELFTVTLAPDDPARASVTVQLVPKQAGAFKAIRLTLAKGTYALQELVLTDPLDSATQMTFSNVVMNKDIPDSEFAFTPPAGVKVIKAGTP